MARFPTIPKFPPRRPVGRRPRSGTAGLLAFLGFSLGIIPVLGAQSAEPQGSSVRLRLLAFQPGQATDQVFLHDPAMSGAAEPVMGVQAPMKSYLNHESVAFVAKSRRVVLTKAADPSSLPQPGQLLGEATLPAGLRSAVLLCLPDATDAKTPFRVMVIDDSKKAFPPGSYRVSNLSPSPVRIELEKRPWVIQPGATEMIVDPPVRHGNLSGMRAFVREGDQWRRIASGIWPHPGDERVIQLLYYHPVARQVQLRAFDDIPPREPESAAIPGG